MAVTISPYNNVLKKFINKEFDLANLKLMLLNNSATFTAADTTVDAVAGANTPPRANEVSGNGWTTGGLALSNVAVTVVTTNDAKLDADDVVATATGGAIGPAYKALLYDATNNVPIAFIDFGGALTAGQDTEFKVVWNASGIYSFTQ